MLWVVAESCVALNDRQKQLLSIVIGSFDAYFVDKIPNVLRTLISAIEDRGLEHEGLYRLSGNVATVKSIGEQCFYDDTIDLAQASVHELTGVVKFILRDMNPPLLTFQYYEEFIASVSDEDDSSNIEHIVPVLLKLPNSNFSDLYMLISHLKRYERMRE